MQMMFNRAVVKQLAQQEYSFYLYDEARIRHAMEELKVSFPQARFLYSMKANPHPGVVRTVLAGGFGADAASLAEVQQACRQGLSPADIQYSAPGKTDEDLQGALGCSTIIADSLGEVERLNKIAAVQGVVAAVGLRINPSFSFEGAAGQPSKFGIDEVQVFSALAYLKSLSHVRVTGFHTHLRSQELRVPVLAQYYKGLLSLAVRLQEALGETLQFLNLGSGLGIPYAATDSPLDIKKLGQALTVLLQTYGSLLPKAQLYLETGRYVVGKSGVYVTQVLDKKTSCGKTFVILHNTLNGFIKPSLAHLVTVWSGEKCPGGCEPLFTSADAFPCTVLTEEKERERVTLAGNLCTAADIVAVDMDLPRLRRGDLVVFTNAGAYGAVLSPMQFAGQSRPKEFFLTADGTILDG